MAEQVSRYFNKIEYTGILVLVNEIGRSINTQDVEDHADKKGAAYRVMKALGNTGIILDIVMSRIAFSKTLVAGEALVRYSDLFTFSMQAIAADSRAAFSPLPAGSVLRRYSSHGMHGTCRMYPEGS